jgi:hypothetical protein
MNEKNENLLSCAENELIGKEEIRNSVLSRAKRGTSRGLGRALIPIAACLLVLAAAVLAIPSARAQMFAWFGINKPEQYLSGDPEERVPVEALDDLIVKPTENGGSVTENMILFTADEPIWKSIAEEFDIELGEALVDGENMYLTVNMYGLTALPELEKLVGGRATRTVVPADLLPPLFQGGRVPEIFADGSAEFWEEAETYIWLVLEDGTELQTLGLTSFANDPAASELIAKIESEYPRGDEWITEEADWEGRTKAAIEWLEGRTLTAVVQVAVSYLGYADEGDPMEILSRNADENGMLKAKVVYRASSGYPYNEKKLEAELGTAIFNVAAYQSIEKKALVSAGEPSVLSERGVILSHSEWFEEADSMTYALTNLEAELEGVTFTVCEGAYINALGVWNAGVRVSFPENWTDEQCEAFSQCLSFSAEAEGCKLEVSGLNRNKAGERTYEFRIRHIYIPYDMVSELDSIRLVPSLTHMEYRCTAHGAKQPLKIGETVTVREDKDIWFQGGGKTVLEDGVTILVKRG